MSIGAMMLQMANVTPRTSGAIGSTASLGTITLSNVTTVANNVTQFGSSVNTYSFAGNTISHATIPGGSGFAVGTGDFTVEWFQYNIGSQSFPRIFWYGSTPSLGVSEEGSSSKTLYVWPLASLGSIGTTANTWLHIAVVRISGKLYLYKNGTIINSGGTNYTQNITDTTSTFYVGSKAGSGLSSEQYQGLLTSFRFCKGIGVYTGNFTVPTSLLGQTQSANPYGGSNTSAISSGQCTLLINP